MSEQMKVKEGGFTLLPCAKNVCQECATDHDARLPHNQPSLYYQYKFYGTHGRWPTWTDAMAHCSKEVKDQWTRAMKDLGHKVT